MAVIHSLKGIVFILTGELAVIYCLSKSFSSSYYNYSLEYLQSSILPTVLYIFLTFKFAAIQFGSCPFFQCFSKYQPLSKKLVIKAAILSEQHRLNWNENSHLKQLLFQILFFRIPSCLKQLLLSSNYFLKIKNCSNQLLLEDK